jgi:hypothetical protein
VKCYRIGTVIAVLQLAILSLLWSETGWAGTNDSTQAQIAALSRVNLVSLSIRPLASAAYLQCVNDINVYLAGYLKTHTDLSTADIDALRQTLLSKCPSPTFNQSELDSILAAVNVLSVGANYESVGDGAHVWGAPVEFHHTSKEDTDTWTNGTWTASGIAYSRATASDQSIASGASDMWFGFYPNWQADLSSNDAVPKPASFLDQVHWGAGFKVPSNSPMGSDYGSVYGEVYYAWPWNECSHSMIALRPILNESSTQNPARELLLTDLRYAATVSDDSRWQIRSDLLLFEPSGGKSGVDFTAAVERRIGKDSALALTLTTGRNDGIHSEAIGLQFISALGSK